MMNQLILTTIAGPFMLGIAAALAAVMVPNRRGLMLALLVPLAAIAIHFMLEGVPAFPPVSAKQKMPVILFAAAVLFGILAFARQQPGRVTSMVLTAIPLAAATWWLGKTVLPANPVKSAVVLAIFTVAACAVGLSTAASAKARQGHSSALPTALLSVSAVAAITAAFGAFVGMAQVNGALAAFIGGWLLVTYIRFLRGDDEALALRGYEGVAFAFVISIHVIMTALFSPKAAPAALVMAAMPLAVAAFILVQGVTLERFPRALRPIAAGIVTALPAILAIVIAATLFEG